MKIETAVNLDGHFLSGHIINEKLTFTNLLGNETAFGMDKTDLNAFILELQQVYSTLVQNEKLTTVKPQPRTTPAMQPQPSFVEMANAVSSSKSLGKL